MIIEYEWSSGTAEHSLAFARVEGTHGAPYSFGKGSDRRDIDVTSFFIATVPVTQALWTDVMGAGSKTALTLGDRKPMENVSWDDVTRSAGFLDRINASGDAASATAQGADLVGARFRLPSETEWEYAARGGPHWDDGFQYSGGNDIDAVAWYDRNSGDRTRDVGQKAANQLGAHDMSGNIWEWCQDSFTRDTSRIPTDGSAYTNNSEDRVLRGGCYHNWAMHCTVTKRYEIGRAYHDGAIGFRLALSARG